jgi:uncharacterized protein involved in exopolysaccharide biosynthesis
MQRIQTSLVLDEARNFKARIFLPIFALACAAGLIYVFSRPAVYVSSARLQIEVAPRSGSTSN